jgi:hypothetical protein
MLFTLLPSVTEVKPSQLEKAAAFILSTLLGIVSEDKPKQPAKAAFSILFTLLGIVTEVKPKQPRKALSPMLVTLYAVPLNSTDSGITISPEYLPLLFAITVAFFVAILTS